jgi:hypothetical protein
MDFKTIHVLDLEPIALTSEWETFKEKLVSQYGADALHGMSNPQTKIMSSRSNNLIETLYFAFQYHLGIRITPSIIWLQILHGIGNHINNEPEKWRSHCVSHTEKIKLIVRDDSLIPGKDDNQWGLVVEKFVEQMNNYISMPLRDNFQIAFSEETYEEKVAFSSSLMSTMQHYFKFECQTLCGIPKIEIAGTPEDWQKIIEKAEVLTQYFEMQQWGSKLLPILNGIKGSLIDPGFPSINFWRSIYKHDSMSGGPYINGWIIHLFPYLKTLDSNSKTVLEINTKLLVNYEKENLPNVLQFFDTSEITMEAFPSGITIVPVDWKYLGKEFKLILEAGFMGVMEVDKNILSPFIGWCIRDEIYNKPKKESNGPDWDNLQGFSESGNNLKTNTLLTKPIKFNFLKIIKKSLGFK